MTRNTTDSGGRWSDLLRLAPYVRARPALLVSSAMLLLLSVILTLPQPLVLRRIIDDVIGGGDPRGLGGWIGLLALLSVAAIATQYFGRIALTHFQQRLLATIQHDLLDRLLALPIAFLVRERAGALLGRMRTDLAALQGVFSAGLLEAATGVVSFAGGVVLLLMISPSLTLFAALLLPFYVLAARALGPRLRRAAAEQLDANAGVIRNLHETLGAASVIKLFGLEPTAVTRLQSALDRSVAAVVMQQRLLSAGVALVMAGAAFATVVVLWRGALEVLSGGITLGELVAFNTYLIYLYRPIGAVVTAHLVLQPVAVAARRIGRILDETPDDAPDAAPVPDLARDVELRDIAYTYPGKSEATLRGFSLRIRHGERIAVVGASGSGKSTLVALLMGMRVPTEGAIVIDGIEGAVFSRRDLRRHVVVVPQDPFLFDASLLNNVLVAKPDATADQLACAVRGAGLETLVARLPEGIHTVVGECGNQLSMGERQRVMLARALVRKADLLVLDEATSAMDPESEAAVMRGIDRWARDGKRTVIALGHRISAAEWADRVVFLENGAIVAEGRHDDLLDACPRYRDHWRVASPDLAPTTWR